MTAILALAVKDIRTLFRVKSGLFFAFVWPLLVAVLFGVVFGDSSGDGPKRLAIALADDDQTAASRDLAVRITASDDFAVQTTTRAEAIDLVRKGRQAAAVILPKGFGTANERMFHGEPPQIEIWSDPSRKAEAAMIEGLLFQKIMQGFGSKLTNPTVMRADLRKSMGELEHQAGVPDKERASILRFLRSMDQTMGEMPQVAPSSGGSGGVQWQPLKVARHEVSIHKQGPSNSFEITFPQGLLWGVLGCAMAFAIGFVTERTQGTLLRLQMAPISRVQLLAGKALACGGACLIVELTLWLVGRFAFHVVPHSWPLLFAAGVSTAVAFVGIMMLVAGLGKTEQAASGIGWATMMPLTLFGGGAIPLAFMPEWMVRFSVVSPARWAILATEGATWRGFTPLEMLLPCAVLTGIGVICFAIGTRTMRLS